MWNEFRKFNKPLNDELGEALVEYFFLKLPHHRINSLLHLWPTNVDDIFHGALLEARLFEKLCSTQLLSPLGSSGFQSTQASCVFHRLRLEKRVVPIPCVVEIIGMRNGWTHRFGFWLGKEHKKQEHEGCTEAKRLQPPTIKPLYTVRQSLSTRRNFPWHAMMYSTPMKKGVNLSWCRPLGEVRPRSLVFFFLSFSYRAAPDVQTLRAVPVRQETAAFALTAALGPRRSLLVINRVDVETRPFALTRSFVVDDAVYFKLVPPCAQDRAVEGRSRS